MISDLFNFLSSALNGNSFVALFAAFGWGIVSIVLSPCHLSSIPLIVGFISSRGKISLARTFQISLVFAFGILITIALIGFLTAAAGRLLGDVGPYGNYFVAGIFFLVGLYLLDIIKLPWEGKALKSTKSKGLVAALVLGLLFGIALGPCTFAFMAPVLGVVFQTAKTNFLFAILLLLSFSIGHCLLIVVAGVFTNKVQRYLNWADGNKTIVWIRRISGILVILGGVYLILNVN